MDIRDLNTMITEWIPKQDQANELIKDTVSKCMRGGLMEASTLKENVQALDVALKEVEKMKQLLEDLKNANLSAAAVLRHL